MNRSMDNTLGHQTLNSFGSQNKLDSWKASLYKDYSDLMLKKSQKLMAKSHAQRGLQP